MLAKVEPHALLDVFRIYFEAFDEHDPTHRVELLARCMTPDAEIWGPNRLFAGYAAISGKIAAFHGNWPGCRLVMSSGFTTFDQYVRIGNAIVRADGSLVARGQSITELAPDGRMRRVVPMWEATLPPLPADWPAHLAAPPASGV